MTVTDRLNNFPPILVQALVPVKGLQARSALRYIEAEFLRVEPGQGGVHLPANRLEGRFVERSP